MEARSQGTVFESLYEFCTVKKIIKALFFIRSSGSIEQHASKRCGLDAGAQRQSGYVLMDDTVVTWLSRMARHATIIACDTVEDVLRRESREHNSQNPGHDAHFSLSHARYDAFCRV